jgi:hypothetical protein
MIMWVTSTVVKHPLLAVDNSEDVPPAQIPFFFERTLIATHKSTLAEFIDFILNFWNLY